jgi:hypothetical protein
MLILVFGLIGFFGSFLYGLYIYDLSNVFTITVLGCLIGVIMAVIYSDKLKYVEYLNWSSKIVPIEGDGKPSVYLLFSGDGYTYGIEKTDSIEIQKVWLNSGYKIYVHKLSDPKEVRVEFYCYKPTRAVIWGLYSLKGKVSSVHFFV